MINEIDGKFLFLLAATSDAGSTITASLLSTRAMNNPLYRRVDDDSGDSYSLSTKDEAAAATVGTHSNRPPRGRHLVANTPIEKGRLIFCERPLLALQSLENQRYVSICHCCKAFIGGPDYALQHRTSCRGRQHHGQPEAEQQHAPSTEDSPATAPNGDSSSLSPCQVVPCRLACGHSYCSPNCEADAWQAFHAHLCTGKCVDETHPLVQFKQFAVQTNEILLLVAEWWVAQHTTIASRSRSRSLLQLHNEDPSVKPRTDTTTFHGTDASVSPSSYTDFVMEPWWDVVTLDLNNTSHHPEGSGDHHHHHHHHGDDDEAVALQSSLQRICHDAADLLRQVFAHEDSSSLSSSSLPMIRIPPITALDIAKRIGACEQNSMGIRQRHPLCRNVLEDKDLRQRRHDDIVHCLVESGFIGHDHDDDDDDSDDDDDDDDDDDVEPGNAPPRQEAGTVDNDEVKEDQPVEKSSVDEVWEYSVDEIASFLAGVFMDEEGTVRVEAKSSKNNKDKNKCEEDEEDEEDDDDDDAIQQERDTVGDDLDYIFPPLDGTAMYATACKMNHSCDPNVIVMYRPRKGWGSQYPLTAYCVALKDIAPNEELTISYIETDLSYEQRSKALAHYGFQCNCVKCEKEKNKNGECFKAAQDPKVDEDDGLEEEQDLFGGGDDDGDDNVDDIASGDIVDQDDETDGDTALQQRLERLDTVMNHTRYASIPLTMHGRVAAFVVQTVNEVVSSSSGLSVSDDKVVIRLLQLCSQGLQVKDFSLCRTVGCDLEETLYSMLLKYSIWPSVQHREAYWCAALTAAAGYSHDCSFLKAQKALDKAVILGLSIKSVVGINEFVQYVECHATETTVGPYPPCITSAIPNYQEPFLISQLSNSALSRPVIHSVLEKPANEITADSFHADFVSKSAPLVLRGFAVDWPALNRWRDLQYLAKYYGHRLVPIELGSMMTGEMVEKVAAVRDFINSFLVPSTEKACWNLDEIVSESQQQKVAYLAQHPLLDQISALRADVDMKPVLCGGEGPSHVYLWVGTCGTRTPLHFDSYDNLFVQLAGAKFVRIYQREETPKLYVSKKSVYGLQGNMSELDCEREDWTKYPLAKDAAFQEVLLLPGDALFIPSNTWHYVRSLSTSISINYWF